MKSQAIKSIEGRLFENINHYWDNEFRITMKKSKKNWKKGMWQMRKVMKVNEIYLMSSMSPFNGKWVHIMIKCIQSVQCLSTNLMTISKLGILCGSRLDIIFWKLTFTNQKSDCANFTSFWLFSLKIISYAFNVRRY